MPSVRNQAAIALQLVSTVEILQARLIEVDRLVFGRSELAAPERSALYDLLRTGAATVPDLARQRGLSRQRMQQRIDALEAEALVESISNPRSRRSPLWRLSPRGKRRVLALLRREIAVYAALPRAPSRTRLEAANGALLQFHVALSEWLENQRRSARAGSRSRSR